MNIIGFKHYVKNAGSAKMICLLIYIASCLPQIAAQEMSNRNEDVTFPQMKKFFFEMERNTLDLPEVNGFVLLKADFHLHTIFSDGYVWPTTRVEEAFLEGIDVIAITDHLENMHNAKYFSSTDRNQPYEIAKKLAEDLGIILIKGTEITRDTAAGHYNAIFIKDANPFLKFVNSEKPSDPSNIKETLLEAKKQGAFIFWNHPWDKQPNKYAIWHPIHEELTRAGLIMGIEVNNRDRYYPEIFKWCIKNNLTLISNTDAHNPLFCLEKGKHRSMTILFAKERTQKGIREALDNKNTIAYTQNYLYGNEREIKLLFQNSIETKTIHTNEKSFIVELKNKTGIPFNIEIKSSDGLTVSRTKFIIREHDNCALILKSEMLDKNKTYVLKVEVANLHIGPETPFAYEFQFKP